MSKYGYDMNGEEITESTIEELTRIVEEELLPKTELAKMFEDEHMEIEHSKINYYATGTAFGADVRYTILLHIWKLAKDLVNFENKDYTGIRLSTDKRIAFNVFIDVHNDTATAFINNDVEDIVIEDDYTDFFAKRFEAIYDTAKIAKYIEEIAEKDLYNIRATISNI